MNFVPSISANAWQRFQELYDASQGWTEFTSALEPTWNSPRFNLSLNENAPHFNEGRTLHCIEEKRIQFAAKTLQSNKADFSHFSPSSRKGLRCRWIECQKIWRVFLLNRDVTARDQWRQSPFCADRGCFGTWLLGCFTLNLMRFSAQDDDGDIWRASWR